MPLDKSQADAVADAIMQPGHIQQAAAAKKRAAAEREQAAKRFFAICGLVGFAAGGAIGYLASFPIARAALVGAVSGMLLGRIYKWAIAGRQAA